MEPRRLLWLLLLPLTLLACRAEGTAAPRSIAEAKPAVSVALTVTVETPPPPSPSATTAPSATPSPPPSPTPVPSSTPTVPPTATPTHTPTPTATPIGPCSQRIPSDDDLLTIITVDYAISEDYEPGDLVPLADYLSHDVHLGYPTEVRAVIIEPLVEMVEAMEATGLAPMIVSGYRSYYSQGVAWTKWNRLYPDWADKISMRPGYSEHQLGTTVDFASPELVEVVGDPSIEFHPYFDRTSEGQWLLEHAHEYGFTMSYPHTAIAATNFFYEPWHYRYVGAKMATRLKEQALSLTEYQLEAMPAPCIPDEQS